MKEKDVKGVEVKKTGNKQWERDYGEGDIEVVLSRGDWQDWDDAINWLEENGEQDNELTPGEAVAMAEDLRDLRDQGEPYSSNSAEVYKKAHKFRSQHPRA